MSAHNRRRLVLVMHFDVPLWDGVKDSGIWDDNTWPLVKASSGEWEMKGQFRDSSTGPGYSARDQLLEWEKRFEVMR
ncbi:MAG TPA: hypothetical protein PKA27_15765 [Fimbriimonadaceae bacterium]|nr:hypothetical protein [Fimbriimonadaceae bacterium]